MRGTFKTNTNNTIKFRGPILEPVAWFIPMLAHLRGDLCFEPSEGDTPWTELGLTQGSSAGGGRQHILLD